MGGGWQVLSLQKKGGGGLAMVKEGGGDKSFVVVLVMLKGLNKFQFLRNREGRGTLPYNKQQMNWLKLELAVRRVLFIVMWEGANFPNQVCVQLCSK